MKNEPTDHASRLARLSPAQRQLLGRIERHAMEQAATLDQADARAIGGFSELEKRVHLAYQPSPAEKRSLRALYDAELVRPVRHASTDVAFGVEPCSLERPSALTLEQALRVIVFEGLTDKFRLIPSEKLRVAILSARTLLIRKDAQ